MIIIQIQYTVMYRLDKLANNMIGQALIPWQHTAGKTGSNLTCLGEDQDLTRLNLWLDLT